MALTSMSKIPKRAKKDPVEACPFEFVDSESTGSEKSLVRHIYKTLSRDNKDTEGSESAIYSLDEGQERRSPMVIFDLNPKFSA